MILSSKVDTVNVPLRKRKILLLLLFLLVLVFSGLVFKSQLTNFVYQNIIIRTYLKSLGIGGVDRNVNPVSILKDFSNNIFDSFKEIENFDTLIVDIKFEDYLKLKESRDLALEDGWINKTSFNNVKAKLRVGEKNVKANLRLKGLFLDHVATDKWSLRVKVKNDNIDGIRDFTINGPHTKDFHSAPLINSVMRDRGILAPRSKFYKVILNGNNLGVMYFEERYSEQFTENSGRPFGPIVYFDEKAGMYTFLDDKKFWNNDQNLEFIYANITSIQKHPQMYIDLIDQNLWAEYLAVNFLFKCFHGNMYGNDSYYFHPIEKSLQPISSDNSCAQKHYSRELGFLPYKNEFIYRLIRVKSFKEKLKEKLNWWLRSEEAGKYLIELNKKEELLRRSLSKDAPFLGSFFIDNSHLEEVIIWINDIDNVSTDEITIKENYSTDSNIVNNSIPAAIKNTDETIIPVIEIQRNNSKYLLKINDYSLERYSLKELIIKTLGKEIIINLEGLDNFSEISKSFNDVFLKNNFENIIKVEFTFTDLKKDSAERKVKANLSYAEDNSSYFITSTYEELLKYFSLDKKNNLFFLDSGKSIILEKSLIFPENYDLLLEQGSSIKFRNNSGIVLKGGLRVTGKEDAKVSLSGFQNENWSGVLILAKGNEVLIDNLIVNGGNGLINEVQHRGAFTINKANVSIKNSVFQNNLSEDALNLVQVKGNLDNITIQNTLSDGLDIDFGEVLVSHSLFQNIGKATGADAIDLSKSNVKIDNVQIYNVTDKGVSVGEDSKAKISNLDISSAFVGIVAKDSSVLSGYDVVLKDIIFADTMTYRKKPQFNGANLKLNNLQTTLGNHIAQKMSNATINGRRIEPKELDIDVLYNNVMKSKK